MTPQSNPEHDPALVEAVAKTVWEWDLEDKPDAPTWEEAVHIDQETMRDGAIAILDTVREHDAKTAQTCRGCISEPSLVPGASLLVPDADCPVHGDKADEHEAIHGWFGLSYANYLTVPRSLLQSMPDPWQNAFVRLLRELQDSYRHLKWPRYNVQAGQWCYLNEVDGATLEALGIKSECVGISVGDRKHDPSECSPGQCQYYDRDGDALDDMTACVFIPGDDPMPHYGRGRTRVPRTDELERAEAGQ